MKHKLSFYRDKLNQVMIALKLREESLLQIRESFDVTHGSACSVVQSLGYSKICTNWILMEEQVWLLSKSSWNCNVTPLVDPDQW